MTGVVHADEPCHGSNATPHPSRVKKAWHAPTNRAMDESTSSARRAPRLTREVWVWLYVTALAIVGAAAWALFTHDGCPPRRAAPAVVGGRARLRLRRDLRRPRQLPPQRALLLAGRRALRLRPRLRHRRRLRARRARRHRHRLGPDPPPAARQALLQPGAAGHRGQPRGRDPAPRGRRRRRAAARDLGRPVRRDARQRRADDRPARRRDRDRRGQPAAADARPDVRHRRAGDADQRQHRDRRRARRGHRPARRPGAARPRAHRLRRLPRLHLRAPAP